ncbi:acetyl-CoA carboxylase biotin carboxyl carrier protein [Acetobacterium paludosum]|uniref:Biotin carboxyl carrier protein of acetyl-CoA carboxylase n=1 Tax=Acetobacterium paludosum TaxID=52693 RepID=A0A923HWZ2_9FIRM|nr:acetyl-CoA carboxylase biotin carboxyl carrier protein [Acetobacterium paludosum]MBC3889831.1 acetyl-CoA carboxylase biotin carboxyl carrier protein [Acetobacterium paludosum]
MELTTEIILTLAKVMSAENLTSLSIDQGNLKIEMKREIVLAQASLPSENHFQEDLSQNVWHKTQVVEAEPIEPPIDAQWKEIKSPMVGVFYQGSQPDKPPYVSRGQHFEEGDTLCIIEAMKLMNEITAETSGTIMEVCVGNGQVVEYGQVLYRIKEEQE